MGNKKVYITVSTAFLITLLYFLFHFHFMQRYVDHDQVVYYYNIYYSKTKPFVNPHHLHFELSGKIFHEFMLKHFGKYGFTDMAFNLRLRSLLFGCLGIFSAVILTTGLTGRLIWGILCSILIGFSHGFLLYTPKIDTAIFSASWVIFSLLSAFMMFRARKYLYFLSIFNGIILFTGIMLHQYFGISCIAAFVSLILPAVFFSFNLNNSPMIIKKHLPLPRTDSFTSSRYYAVLIMTLTATLLTVAAYFYTGRVYLNLSFDKRNTSWNRIYKDYTFQEWLFFYKVKGDELKTGWGDTENKKKFEESFRGLTDSFITPRKIGPKWNHDLNFNYDLANPIEEKSFIFNQLAFFLIIFATGTILLFPCLWRRYGRNYLAIILNLSGYAFLGTYWEPFYLEFWLIPAILIIIMSILLLNYIGERLSEILSDFSHIPFYAYILFFITVTGLHNMQYYLIPHTRNVYYFGVAEWKDKKDYYKKLNSRGVYKNFYRPYTGLYNKSNDVPKKNNYEKKF